MSSQMSPRDERTIIGDSLDISRIIIGLWQRGGGNDRGSTTDMTTAVDVMDQKYA